MLIRVSVYSLYADPSVQKKNGTVGFYDFSFDRVISKFFFFKRLPSLEQLDFVTNLKVPTLKDPP